MLKKFPLLFLVLLIEGGALMAVELMGAKLVAPFYGGSLYVWTAVLTITVLGLTLGYYAGGRLSRKQPSETMLFIILGISALLVLALPLTASVAIALTKGTGLIIGICITCALLLLPPMFCFGMVGPMVVALMSSQLETVGKTAGTVYFTSTLGGIAATFFLGLYFIPVGGLRLCATITGLALAALPAIYCLKKFFGGKGKPGSSLPATGKRAKVSGKNSVVRDRLASMIRATGVKRSIYLFAVLEGATVMVVELLSARMVAPYFGSSLYVWATVIGFTLLALAIGYFVGGIIADRYSDPDTLLWVLLIASFFLMLMHVSAPLLTIAFVKIDPGVAVILVSMILILPPLTFMGMVPPILIRKVSASVDHAGRSTGVVYAISSASGIIALPLFGFFIIPRLGLTLPSILVGAVVGLIPFIELISRKKYISLLFIPFVLFSFWTIKAVRPGKDVDIRYYSEGLLGQLLVTDVSNHHGKQVNVRLLFVNRIAQTGVDQDTLKPTGADIYYVSSVCSRRPKKSNALILGLGGGSIASILNNLEFKVDAVELDQRVAEVARQYFALSDNVNVIVDDARHYLEETQKKYDVILFDVYRGELPPPHVITLESLIRAKSLLKEDGLIVVNFNGFLEGKPGLPARSIYKTLLAAGLEARILPTPGAVAERSIVLVASMKKQDFHAVRGALSLKNEKPANLETLFLDPRELDLNDAVVLTDDRPILELLNIPAGNTWRKVHIPFTRTFYEEGVPLFK